MIYDSDGMRWLMAKSDGGWQSIIIIMIHGSLQQIMVVSNGQWQQCDGQWSMIISDDENFTRQEKGKTTGLFIYLSLKNNLIQYLQKGKSFK